MIALLEIIVGPSLDQIGPGSPTGIGAGRATIAGKACRKQFAAWRGSPGGIAASLYLGVGTPLAAAQPSEHQPRRTTGASSDSAVELAEN